MNLNNILSILLISLALLSCQTLDSVRTGNGTKFAVTGIDFSTIWRSANSVTSRQLTIVYVDKSAGIIKAEKGAGIATWGEVVGIFISPTQAKAKSYTVEVVSKKRSALQISGQNWETTISEGIKAELGVD